MDRRHFLKSSSVATVAGATALTPAVAAGDSSQVATSRPHRETPLRISTAAAITAPRDPRAEHIANDLVARFAQTAVAIGGPVEASVDQTRTVAPDIVIADGAFGLSENSDLIAFAQVPTAAPIDRQMVAAWLMAFGGAAHWQAAAAEIGWIALPLAVLSPVSVAKGGTAERFEISGNDTARFAIVNRPHEQTDLRAAARGALFAVFVRISAWNTLSLQQQAQLEMAAHQTLTQDIAEALVFDREVWPTLAADVGTRAQSEAESSVRLAIEFRQHLAATSKTASAIIAAFDRLGGTRDVETS